MSKNTQPAPSPFDSKLVSDRFSHLTKDLDTKGVPEGDVLKTLGELLVRFKESQERLDQLEAAMKEEKAKYNQLGQVDIPNLLFSNGLSEIKLASGEKVKVSQEISCSVVDMDEFSAFVEDRGDSSILKTAIELGRVPAEIVEKIRAKLAKEFGLGSEAKQTVHSATLKKYIKEICGVGMEPEEIESRLGDRYIPLQELPNFVSVYTYNKTAIVSSPTLARPLKGGSNE